LNTAEELKDLKESLKQAQSMTFNTNVIRIALNMKEEKIASLIVAYYTVKIDKEMIMRAIKTA
jgi:SUMO ligase MMS21 Smc5/6 complex component